MGDKLFGYELSDPLVKRLRAGKRKRQAMASVRRVKNTEKQLVKMLGGY